MTTPQNQPNLPMTIAIDAEHIGVRLLIPVLTIVGIFGGVALAGMVQTLLGELVSLWCVVLVLAGLMAFIFAQIGERVIKPLWPSGRYLVLDHEGLTLHYRKANQKQHDYQFRWIDEPTVHSWYWEVETRKSRVQRGWYCLAVRLSADERHLTLYTFMSLTTAETLPRFQEWFVKLLPKTEREKMTASDPRGAAIQSRYKQLESERWLDGAEVSADDFALVMFAILEQ